jgi:sortase A
MIQVLDKLSLRHDGIKFIFYPIVLFVVAVALFMATLFPVIKPYINMAEIFFLEEPPQFGEDQIGLYGNTVALQNISLPHEGEIYGNITIENAGVDAPVLYGDSPADLRAGVGTYTGTYIPGKGRTILLAGHKNTVFNTLHTAEIGDIVVFTTNYGKFHYEITGSKETRFDDTTAYDLEKEEENLIMYTCTGSVPFGATPYRLFVYAKYLPSKTELFIVKDGA